MIILIVPKTVDEDTVIGNVPCIDNGSFWIVPFDCEEELVQAGIVYRKHGLGEELCTS